MWIQMSGIHFVLNVWKERLKPSNKRVTNEQWMTGEKTANEPGTNGYKQWINGKGTPNEWLKNMNERQTILPKVLHGLTHAEQI